MSGEHHAEDRPEDPRFDDDPSGYEPPEVPKVAGQEMAGRWVRLGAVLIDGVIAMVIVLPLMAYAGVFDGILDYFEETMEAARQGKPPPEPNGTELMTMGMMIRAFIIAWATFFILHGYLLWHHGQTIAKRLLGIKIVDEHGNVPGFGKLVVMRYLVLGAASNLPLIGGIVGLVDALLIFRQNRRCLHDDLAGTYVVRA